MANSDDPFFISVLSNKPKIESKLRRFGTNDINLYRRSHEDPGPGASRFKKDKLHSKFDRPKRGPTGSNAVNLNNERRQFAGKPLSPKRAPPGKRDKYFVPFNKGVKFSANDNVAKNRFIGMPKPHISLDSGENKRPFRNKFDKPTFPRGTTSVKIKHKYFKETGGDLDVANEGPASKRPTPAEGFPKVVKKQWGNRSFSNSSQIRDFHNNSKMSTPENRTSEDGYKRKQNNRDKKQQRSTLWKKSHSFKKSPNMENRKSGQDKMTAFQKAMMEYGNQQKLKESKKKEADKINRAKQEALARYKKKKKEKFIKLLKKTKKGQPVMKERMELLLDKIQKSIESEGVT